MFIYLYLIAIPIFFAVDMLWLVVIAKAFYRRQMESLMRSDVGWGAAIAFYLLFVLGLTLFVILPAYVSHSFARAFFTGGFFGLVSYATYDLTNLATLKGFSRRLAIVDMTWGTVLACIVSSLTYLIATAVIR